MKLSIVTINYNNKNGLQKTIDSVISQTYKDFEWIIIDGGSTDGSKELIEQYTDYITYWVSEPDTGIYNAMNKGIKVARGEYLLFLNSGDSLYEMNVLKKTIPLLGGKDIYVGYEQLSSCPNKEITYKYDFTPEGVVHRLIFKGIPHQATFFHRNVFSVYGMYREDKQILSDLWVLYRSLMFGSATIEALPFIISIYDMTGISIVRKDLLLREQEDLLKENPRFYCLYQFYRDNWEIVSVLKGNRFFFNLFRIYFYIYRKWLRKK